MTQTKGLRVGGLLFILYKTKYFKKKRITKANKANKANKLCLD